MRIGRFRQNTFSMLPIVIKSKLTSTEKNYLIKKINAVFCEIGLPANISRNLENELVEKYAEPHRAYHNLSHILSFFKIMDASEVQPKYPSVFQLAILFHDIIYEIGNKNNETHSAVFAAQRLTEHLPKKELNLLKNLIESTANHKPLSGETDLQLFLDFDIAVLAAPTEGYQKYALAIRKEFKKYPTLMYRYGRRKVLRYFLQKERIYLTDHFFEKYELQARTNLQTELKSLTSHFS